MKLRLTDREQFLMSMVAYLMNGSDRNGEQRTEDEVMAVLNDIHQFTEIDVVEDELDYHGLGTDDFEWSEDGEKSIEDETMVDLWDTLGLQHLEETGFNEYDAGDLEEMQEADMFISLFHEMRKRYVEPIFEQMASLGYDTDEMTFNYFAMNDIGTDIDIVFYEPEVSITLSDYTTSSQQLVEYLKGQLPKKGQ